MCVGGMPSVSSSHSVDAVLTAMAMRETIRAFLHGEDDASLGIRIGIHTGPVVAGVVGVQKFAYDIWGETVDCRSGKQMEMYFVKGVLPSLNGELENGIPRVSAAIPYLFPQRVEEIPSHEPTGRRGLTSSRGRGIGIFHETNRHQSSLPFVCWNPEPTRHKTNSSSFTFSPQAG